MAHLKEALCLLVAILIFNVVVEEVSADAMVTGTVFCDQCKDGKQSFFDYPLYGARVAIACMGSNGAMTTYREESTNWLGSYTMRLEGSPDLSTCYSRVVEGPSGCGAAAGPAQGLKLMFSMWGMEMYAVDPLLSQPQQPMPLCPNTAPHSATPAKAIPHPPPTAGSHDSVPPPLSLLEASACSYDKWMMQKYKCYWKVVSPDTKVAVAFGPVAAGKYGTDMTLWEGLQKRADIYGTLLREATTALLNSYNSLTFFYPTLGVIEHMNWALLGSPQQALMTALRFKRANAVISGRVTCKFSPCS